MGLASLGLSDALGFRGEYGFRIQRQVSQGFYKVL